mmetsp:Transcript_19776/g.63610  ORF Transcript_19776/g.63610 Transcript_19776/m.63610 type:complete len:367 (+) Transcript_19776:1394-2494(+)
MPDSKGRAYFCAKVRKAPMLKPAVKVSRSLAPHLAACSGYSRRTKRPPVFWSSTTSGFSRVVISLARARAWASATLLSSASCWYIREARLLTAAFVGRDVRGRMRIDDNFKSMASRRLDGFVDSYNARTTASSCIRAAAAAPISAWRRAQSWADTDVRADSSIFGPSTSTMNRASRSCGRFFTVPPGVRSVSVRFVGGGFGMSFKVVCWSSSSSSSPVWEDGGGGECPLCSSAAEREAAETLPGDSSSSPTSSMWVLSSRPEGTGAARRTMTTASEVRASNWSSMRMWTASSSASGFKGSSFSGGNGGNFTTTDFRDAKSAVVDEYRRASKSRFLDRSFCKVPEDRRRRSLGGMTFCGFPSEMLVT